MEKHIEIKLNQLRIERENTFAKVMEELNTKGMLCSSALPTRLYDIARNEMGIVLSESWKISRLSLENIENKNQLNLEVEKIKHKLTNIISHEYRRIVKEIVSRCVGGGLYTDTVGLKRKRRALGEYVKCLLFDYEGIVDDNKYERLKRINANDLQEKSLIATHKQANASRISAIAAIVLLGVTFYNSYQGSKAANIANDANNLTKKYVQATLDQAENSKKQYNFMFTQWQRDNMPSIIVDYTVNWYDSDNMMVNLFAKNVGKGVCENLNYAVDVTNSKGTIQRLYTGQEVNILSGNVANILNKMKSGFRVDTTYSFAGENIKQSFVFKLDIDKKRQAGMNEIYFVLDNLSKEFESMGQNTRYNISGRLYDINKSLEKLNEKLSNQNVK
ncbi:MAG: hypothetical protein ACYC6C_13140 [Coriobacteriia bacterium]